MFGDGQSGFVSEDFAQTFEAVHEQVVAIECYVFFGRAYQSKVGIDFRSRLIHNHIFRIEKVVHHIQCDGLSGFGFQQSKFSMRETNLAASFVENVVVDVDNTGQTTQ